MFNTQYLIKVPKGLATDPVWHTTLEELGPHQPRLLVGRGRHHSGTRHSQWDTIRKRSFGLLLVTDCGRFAVSPRRFHRPIRSAPHSRESPSIGSSLTFEGLISQSCGADIHSVHSFLADTRRLIRSAAAWSIHPSSCMGIDASIASPAFNLDPFIGHPSRNEKMPVYRAPCICSPIHQDTTTSMALGPSAKPPHPSFFGVAKRRTSSRYQSKGRRHNRLK